MQLVTTKERIVGPLTLVAGAADARGTLPIFGTVLLKATQTGQVSLICSDSGMLARALSPAEVTTAGEIAVDVKRLSDLVRACPDKAEIKISLEEKGTLLVKSGRSRFKLPTHAAADYPKMAPVAEKRLSITMSARRLADMIEDVSLSMASADLRPFLNAALFSLDKTGLWIVSTDGSRMTVGHEPIQADDSLLPKQVIVPRKSVLLAKKLLAQGGNVTLTVGSKDVQITFADATVLLCKGMDGSFPNWRGVIPKPEQHTTIESQRLTSALSMMAVTIEDNPSDKLLKHKVEVSFAPNVTTLQRGDSGVVDMESTSSAKEVCKLAFNIDYLRDAATSIGANAEQLQIGFTPNSSAITVRPKDKDYPLAVVMSLRA